jgi:hypothetical protein
MELSPYREAEAATDKRSAATPTIELKAQQATEI